MFLGVMDWRILRHLLGIGSYHEGTRESRCIEAYINETFSSLSQLWMGWLNCENSSPLKNLIRHLPCLIDKMASKIPFLTEEQLRFFLICNRVIQWMSSVIVLGITSYFINIGPRGLTITYVEIIVSWIRRHSVTYSDLWNRLLSL